MHATPAIRLLHRIHEVDTDAALDKAQQQFEVLRRTGRAMHKTLKSGLRTETRIAQEKLQLYKDESPELAVAISQDIRKAKQSAKAMQGKVRARMAKLKTTPALQTEEAFRTYYQREIAPLLQRVYEQEESDLKTAQVLKVIRTKTPAKAVVGVVLTVIGNLLVGTINVTMMMFFATMVGPGLGLALAAIFVAPITEELYKFITVRYTGSNLPVWVFALGEMVDYLAKYFMVVQAGPIGILAFLVYVIVRWRAVQMHMATTRLYTSDYEKYGFIRGASLRKGMLMHALWNVAASVLGAFSAIIPTVGAQFAVDLVATKLGVNAIVHYVLRHVKRDPILAPAVQPALAPAEDPRVTVPKLAPSMVMA